MIIKSLQFLNGSWLNFFAGFFLMVFGGAASMGIPLTLGRLFESKTTFTVSLSVLLVLLLIQTICNGYKNYILSKLSNHIASCIRIALMEKILSLPQSYFGAHSSGELLSRIGSDVNRFRDALSEGIIYILEMILSLIVAIVIMFYLEPFLTFVLLITSLFIMLIDVALTKSTEKKAIFAQQALAKINSLASQGILGVQTIQIFHLQKTGLSIFSKKSQEWETKECQILHTRKTVNLLTGILSALQLILILALGLYMINKNMLSIGNLLAFALYAQAIEEPLISAASMLVDIKAALGSMHRVFDILNIKISSSGKYKPAVASHGEIHIENLDFSYPDNSGCSKKIFSNLNLKIPAGKTTALVGKSGSGKTTLLNLIAGFLNATKGKITLDNVSITDLDPEYLRTNISIISQTPYLFEMSVYDNIASGKPDATYDQIIDASKMAGAHEFIKELPNGYETILGENGITLSGGQRQRLAIARAFLRNSPILLIDEATSALDNHTEHIVQQSIQKLSINKTVFIIAHRLSTIQNADKICYLDNGTLCGEGTHDELLSCCSQYQNLYNEQKNSRSQM